MKMEHFSSWCILQGLLALILVSSATSAPCPPPCSCPQPTELHCTFHALFSIPATIPKHTERINLGFNSITQVADTSLWGLRKLQQLMLHGNNIHSLPDGAFRDLASLQMLKMSYNKLQEISRQTLHGLWSLTRLHLDHNHLESIQPDTFQGLTSLRLLQLEGNRLQQLHPSTFSTFSVLDHFHISTVRHLHLSDNELASLPPRLLETMPQLENLYLHGNPWSCDCSMRWLQDWQRTSPGVLKCKNDRDLPGGKLCAKCLSPKHLNGTELHIVENLVCYSPVISSLHRSTQQKDAEREMLKTEDFKEPLGNVSLNLSDEHGNKVDLECSFGEPKGSIKMNWEGVNHQQLVTNLSFSVDLKCPVNRAKYEQLWRLIAYYSSVPARLQEIIRSQTPYPTYTYKQDSFQEAQYYTGVQAKMMTQSAWLMQPSLDLQLNQPQSSAKIIQLILSTNLSKTVESELERKQRRAWVMIESTNRTHKVLSAVLGGSVELYCNVHSSDRPTVQWMLPDGSKLNTAHHSVDNRISASKDGRLAIKTVNHKDIGIYYCISWVQGDFAVLPFYLSIQESSRPPPGKETSITSTEEYPGNPLSLDCTASGSPGAEINWILPSNNIVNFHAKSSKNVVYSNGTLHIPKIQLSDNGYYKCVAINPYGVDTLVKKISVVRRKGLTQPLWTFQTGPLSASRVNTQIKVPSGNTDEEASGDIEMTKDGAPMSHLDLIKKRVTGGVAPGRRVTHPSRKMWERSPLLRKPMGSNPEDRKMTVGNRRRINISKAKIDPQKWADILGKIRGRNTQNSVTMTPIQYPAQTEAIKPTKLLKTPKESSNSVFEHERLNQVTTDGYSAYSPGDITLLNNVQTTIKSQPSQSTQQKLDQLTSSNGVFVLPKTTSASLQAFTVNNTPNSSVFSLQESFSTNTEVDKDKTADWSKAVDSGVNRVNPNLAANSRNDRKHFFIERQIMSSVNLQSASDFHETSIISQFHPQPSDTTINDLNQTVLIASWTTSPVPTSVRKVGSERHPAPRVRQPKSQRKNSGWKKKGNRRKHKLKTPTAPVNTPLPVVKTPTAPVNTPLPVVKTPTTPVNTPLAVVKTPTAPVNTPLPVVKTPTAPVNTPLPVVKTPTAPVNTPLPVVKTPTTPVNTPLPVVKILTAPVNTPLPVVKTPTAPVNTPLPVVKTPTAPVNTPLPVVKTPTAPVNTPLPVVKTPTTPVNTPLAVVKTPTAPVNTPLPVVKTPTAPVNTPLPVVKTPTAPVNTPLPVVKTPTTPVNTPLAVVKTPTAPVNTPLPVVKTPTAPVNTPLPVVKTPTAPVNTPLPVVKTPTTPVNTPLAVVKTPTAPVNTPLPVVKTSVSTELQTEPLKVEVSSIVPFTKSLVALFGTLSQTESTVFGNDRDPSMEASSLPGSPFETKDTHTSTSATPVLPTASLGMDHGSTSSHTILDILESASPATLLTLPKVPNSPPPLEEPSEDIQKSSVSAEMEPLLHSDHSVWGFQTETHLPTDVKNNPSATQHRLSQKGGKAIRKATRMGSSTLSPPLTTAAFVIELGTNTVSGDTSIELNKTPSKISEEYLETENVSKVDQILNETQNMWNIEIPPSSTTSSTLHPVTPSKVQLHTTKPNMSSIEANITPSLRVTTHRPEIKASQSQEQQVNLIIATLESNRSFSFHPTILSPSQKVSVTNPASADVEPQDIQSSIRTADTLLEATKDASTEHQLTKQGLMPRGKSKITKNNFQTVTVKAGRDAQLPCEAEGQPRPLLSWTKVATDAVIAQNTRMQMFEVNLNGTLSIRSSQPVDAGQYLCTVQNENGTDEMVVNLVVLSEPPRILRPRHQDVTVHLGGKVQMDCIVEGHPVPRVTWILPNHIRMTAPSVGGPSQQHISVDNNGTLWISQTGLTNRGIYKCVGNNAVGSDTVSVYLSVVALAPKIQQTQHENMTLPEGGAAYLNCTATGTPQPVISWLTPDGIQLSASQSFSGQNLIVFPNGTLHIWRLDPRNSGSYKCSVKSPMASATRTVTLYIRRDQVSAKATISSSSPQRTNVIYGSMLLLNCVATGEPKPWILWRTPSKKLVDAQYSFDPRIKVLLNGSITIHSVTGKDGGDYLCVARNNMGEDYVQLQVRVLTRPAKIDRKQQQSNQEVVHGKDLKVDCVASGLPNPEISWVLPDGTMVSPVKQGQGTGSWRSRRYVVFDNGTLYFDDVGMPEEGDYTCYAENQLGKDEMKVRVKVKTAVSPPQIQDKDWATIRVFHGQTVELQCNAKGEPPPVITWMSPTNRLITTALDKYQIINDGTLVIQKTQSFDDGNYTCLAKNGAGQDHKLARLEVLVAPPVINNQRVAVNVIEATAVQGQKKLVDCVAKGSPTPQIMWILPGHRILPAPYHSSKMTVHQNGTLEIRSAQKTNSGQLVCVALNDGGEVRLVVNLDVKEAVKKPQMSVLETEHLSLRVGNTMTLNCSFKGSKLPHLTWILPNGTPLHTGARYLKFFHQEDGSLVVSNPTVAEAGMYRCLGHNSDGLVERTIIVTPGRKPEIQNSYISPVSIMNGETLLLHCRITGEAFRLTWTLPSGVVLNRLQRAGRYAIMSNGTLTVHQASIYDRGPYVCRASNEYGSSLLSVSVTVIVHPPKITTNPPSVMYAKRGVAIQLNCIATGVPKVEVMWETPDKTHLAVSSQPRLFGNKYVHPQGSLIIQNPTQRDTGVYRCTAKNAFGMDSKATFLNVF